MRPQGSPYLYFFNLVLIALFASCLETIRSCLETMRSYLDKSLELVLYPRILVNGMMFFSRQ